MLFVIISEAAAIATDEFVSLYQESPLSTLSTSSSMTLIPGDGEVDKVELTTRLIVYLVLSAVAGCLIGSLLSCCICSCCCEKHKDEVAIP
jgi:hypothetical protein